MTEQGTTPIEVLLGNMRFYWNNLVPLMERLKALVEEHPNILAAVPQLDDLLGKILEARKLADESAAKAAPYCHPKLANITVEALAPDGQNLPAMTDDQLLEIIAREGAPETLP